FADFVNAAIRGGVDFDHIDRVPCPYLRARVTDSAGLGHRVVLRAAIERHGPNPGHRRFPDAPMPAENIPLAYPALFNSVSERTRNVFLPDHFGELLRTVLACQNLVAHEKKTKLYVMRRTANAADQFSRLRNKPDVHLDLKLFGFQPFNAEPNDLSFR